MLGLIANKGDAASVFNAAEIFKKFQVWTIDKTTENDYSRSYETRMREDVAYVKYLFSLACKNNLPGLIQKLGEEYNKSSYSSSFDIEKCNKDILIEGKPPLLFALENRHDDLFLKLIKRDYKTDKNPLLLTAITMKNATIARYLVDNMYWFEGADSDFLNKAFKLVLTPPPVWAIFDALVQKATKQIDAKSIEIFIDSLSHDMGERLQPTIDLVTEKLQSVSDKNKKVILELLFEKKKKGIYEDKEAMENEAPQRTLTQALDLLKKSDQQDIETDLNPSMKKAPQDDDSDSVVTFHPQKPDDA